MHDNNTAQMTKCEIGGIGSYIPPTKRQQLQQAKDVLEQQLAKVNAAIDALDKHPDLEEFMNVIEQARILGGY